VNAPLRTPGSRSLPPSLPLSLSLSHSRSYRGEQRIWISGSSQYADLTNTCGIVRRTQVTTRAARGTRSRKISPSPPLPSASIRDRWIDPRRYRHYTSVEHHAAWGGGGKSRFSLAAFGAISTLVVRLAMQTDREPLSPLFSIAIGRVG